MFQVYVFRVCQSVTVSPFYPCHEARYGRCPHLLPITFAVVISIRLPRQIDNIIHLISFHCIGKVSERFI
jgi:hypothetical protein